MDDPFGLERFVIAQSPVIGEVLSELRHGHKHSHWMWFIFPQIKGLGHSPIAQEYGISSAAEAAAYLAHPILGPRLQECTKLVNLIEGSSPEEIFGAVDTLKFRSSMTLFKAAADASSRDSSLFSEALHKYFAGKPDDLTLRILARKQ